MAKPQLQIETRVERLELAVNTLAAFSGTDMATEIGKILRGEKPTDRPAEEENATE